MQENATPNLFNVDEYGNIIYEQNEPSVNEDLESEDLENGEYVDSDASQGDLSADEIEDEEIPSQTQENLVVSFGDDAVPVVLSDEVTAALLDATTPAGGTLASSTLDYFDRIVSGLPSDAIYVAYRTDSDSNYDGVLYYGDDYNLSSDTVIFGKDSRQIHVERVSSGGYSTYTNYTEYDAEDVEVNLSRSGDVVYYSNIDAGYPILGGYEKPFNLSPYLVVGLVTALAVVVLQKLICKR